MTHFVRRCRACHASGRPDILGQCRCPDPNKTTEWVESCDRCLKAVAPPDYLAMARRKLAAIRESVRVLRAEDDPTRRALLLDCIDMAAEAADEAARRAEGSP